jgi:hypothetical protein
LLRLEALLGQQGHRAHTSQVAPKP